MNIYKLTCKKTNQIYIGSSSREYLSQTLYTIEYNYNTWKNVGGYYWAVFDIIKSRDYSIELLEEYNTEEYRQRLQYYIDLNECCINKRRAHSTIEYKLANKETISERKKQYNEANKESIAERKKEYYEANKETISKQTKEYNKANKDAIAEQRKVKITCTCGAVICKYYKSKHERTKQHISRIPSRSLSDLSYPIF